MTKLVLNYLMNHIKATGIQLIYSSLLMIFAYKSPNTPKWAKRVILGAFAYLISPIDAIPDLTPVLGFTDDLSVITFGLVTVACYIDKNIRETAKIKLASIIKNVDTSILEVVDARL